MGRPVISRVLAKQLIEEQIQLRVFYQNQENKKFYLLAGWPCSPDDPVWGDAQVEGFVEGPTPEAAIEAFRDRLYGGL